MIILLNQSKFNFEDVNGLPVPKKATQDVAGRYIQGETRGNSWDAIAQRNAEYSPKIIELGERIDAVENIEFQGDTFFPAYQYKTYYTSEIPTLVFSNIQSERAKSFLSKVQLSRITTSNRNINLSIDPISQSNSMAFEMGLPEEGWESEQAKEITLNQVIERVLEGDMRIAYQSPQPR